MQLPQTLLLALWLEAQLIQPATLSAQQGLTAKMLAATRRF